MASTEIWRRARRIFASILEIPEGERQAQLAAACGGDPALEEAVRSLLEHDTDDGFLERPVELPEQLLEEQVLAPGDRLGAYRIVREIGRGGYGIVYQGERPEADFEQRLAVKVLRSSLARPAARRRFRRERRILAALEHSSIARLVDGGSTPGGLPYVVLEHVEGVPITEFADRRQLGLDRRLELFREVCVAVHYAHQRLIVHRDLKPGNILVTSGDGPQAAGEVKLLDFGIAAILRDTSADEPTETRALTPGYASPEQLLGLPVSTASDIYSLGVILAELLAERRLPVSLDLARGEAVGPLRLSAALAEPGPGERPAAEVAADRGMTPRQLEKRLRGDLDSIVRRPLAADPGERYGSAEQLADDLTRVLEGRPVIARGGGALYRLRKLARRRAGWVAAASLLTVLVLTFAVLAALQSLRLAHQRDSAEQARARAEAVAEVLVDVFGVMDPQLGQPYSEAAKRVLDTGTARVLERFADHPRTRAALEGRLGEIYFELGFFEQAEELLRQSLSFYETAVGEGSAEGAVLVDRLGQLLAVQGKEGAVPLLEEALARRRRAYGDEHPSIAAALAGLAQASRFRGDLERAGELARQAVEIDRRLGLDGDEALERRRGLATVRAMAGDSEGAIELFQELLTIYRRRLGPRHLKVGQMLLSLSALHINQLLYGEAEPLARQALDILQERLGPEHPQVAGAHGNLASALYHGRGDLEAALAERRHALAIDLAHFGEEHPWTLGDRFAIGLILRDQGRLQEAEESLRLCVETHRRAAHPDPVTLTNALNILAETLIDQDRPAAARALLRESRQLREAHFGVDHWQVGYVLRALAKMALAEGRLADCRQLASQAIGLLQGGDGEPWLLADARGILGVCSAPGDPAREFSLQAVDPVCRAMGPWSATTREVARRALRALDGSEERQVGAALRRLIAGQDGDCPELPAPQG